MRPLSEFDPAWPHGHVQKNGRPARIIGEIDHPDQPLVVVYTMVSGKETVAAYGPQGRFCAGSVDLSGRDLINAPAPKKRVQGWVNVYPGGLPSGLYPDKASADSCAAFNRIACAFVDVEEGENLA